MKKLLILLLLVILIKQGNSQNDIQQVQISDSVCFSIPTAAKIYTDIINKSDSIEFLLENNHTEDYIFYKNLYDSDIKKFNDSIAAYKENIVYLNLDNVVLKTKNKSLKISIFSLSLLNLLAIGTWIYTLN